MDTTSPTEKKINLFVLSTGVGGCTGQEMWRLLKPGRGGGEQVPGGSEEKRGRSGKPGEVE